MTGAELIAFIQANSLESEQITIEYFSYEKKLKFCGKCSSLVDLKNFHQGTSGASPEKSSGYRFICKCCLNKAAFHKKYKKKEEMGL